MRHVLKALTAGAIGLAALGLTGAHADDDRRDRRYDDRDRYEDRYDDRRGDYRPDRCDLDHDHRSHAPDYYDYYPADRYSRAGYYGGPRSYDERSYRGYRGSRIVNRDIFRTRGRADIVLTEVIYYGRRRDHLVCTVEARGRDARYVSFGELRRVAARHCSRRAEVRILR